MTIMQTVEIPANRRITLEFPRHVPVGKAQIELKVVPFPKKQENHEEFRLTKRELAEMLQNAQTPISDSLTGILEHLGDITVEQIREERLAKYLK